jgi:uncharacterized protein with FMN-binding domain
LRRAVLTIGGTVAGLAALFSFRTHSAIGAAAISTPEASAPSSSAAASTPAGPTGPAYPTASGIKPPSSAPAGTRTTQAAPTGTSTMLPPTSAPTTKAPTSAPTTKAAPTSAPTTKAPTQAPTTPAPSTSAPAGNSGTFTGPTENTQYGPVEVQIVVSNGRITSANDIIGPADNIGANAVGQLNSEVLSAQNANIQAVSGATYTSQGYISSLQSAVNQAGL